MRMGFGLVGILVTIGIIAWFWGFVAHPADTVRKGQEVRAQAAQIAGVDAATGMPATASIKLSARERNGRLDGLVVESIIPGGPMATYFGLRPDDVIVEIGDAGRVRDIAGGAEMAEALACEAYQRKWPLVIERDGKPLTLPIAGVASTAAPLVTGAPPVTPANPVDRGFDLMKPIPSH